MTSTDWLRVEVARVSGAVAEFVADCLIELGGSAVEFDGDRLRTYLPMPDDPDAVRVVTDRIERSIAAVPGVNVSSISITTVANRDWPAEWRAGLAPRRVGQRLIVAPTWTEPDTAPDDIVLRIDPQMAFGTAEHASTRGALRLLERAVGAGDAVLDVGTGSGILAIAAARLGAARVLAVDNDADALINARENVDANGVARVVRLEHDVVDRAYLESRSDSFDLIAANVLAGVLIPLLPAFAAALVPDGALLLAGIQVEEADVVLAAARSAGFVARETDREDGWWSVWLERPDSRQAEPASHLVDVGERVRDFGA